MRCPMRVPSLYGRTEYVHRTSGRVETKLLGAAIDYLGSSGVGSRDARALLHCCREASRHSCVLVKTDPLQI
jgi:hypothetical protein